MEQQLVWGRAEGLRLTFMWTATSAPRLVRVEAGDVSLEATHEVPFLEVSTVGAGHLSASSRLTHTQIGSRLRYVSHHESVQERSEERRVGKECPV